jgi:hypothetical protein
LRGICGGGGEGVQKFLAVMSEKFSIFALSIFQPDKQKHTEYETIH